MHELPTLRLAGACTEAGSFGALPRREGLCASNLRTWRRQVETGSLEDRAVAIMRENMDFASIYEEFYPKIMHYLKRMVGDNDADDVAQEVFNKISRNLNDFKEESKISTWIYRIATNTALDMLKSSPYKRSAAGSLAPIPVEIIDMKKEVTPSTKNKPQPPDQQLIRDEMNKCIREFVDKLPADYRTIIILNELEGFTNKEIADVLQVSLDTVKVRLHRARDRLRKMLQEGCNFYHDDRSELACDRKQPEDY